MTEPKRIQLSRTKGWRKPEGAVVVSRPTKWGNPFGYRTHTGLARVPAVNTPGAENPTKTSAPWRTSASVPLRSSGLVRRAMSFLAQFMLQGRYL